MTGMTIQRTAGRSLSPSVAPVTPDAIEAAVMGILAPYGRAASWLDVSRTVLARNFLMSEPSAQFRLVNRAGGNKFGPHPLEARHAFKTDCLITGKPTLCFGAGGGGNNPLTYVAASGTSSASGTLVPQSEIDPIAGEIGNPDVFLPNQGVTIAGKIQIPAAGATVNGVTFPEVGGPIVASQAAAAGNSLSLEIATTGYLRLLSRRGNGAGQYLEGWADIRNGSVIEFVRTYSPGLSRYAGWYRVHGAGAITAQATVDTGTTDVSAAAGCSKLMIGGCAQDGVGVQVGAAFFTSLLIVAPDASVGNDPVSRAILFALAAIR